MNAPEIQGCAYLVAAFTGFNHPVNVVLLVLVVTAAMPLLPQERGRPLRIGFFLVAPLVVVVALAVAFVAGCGAAWFIMFGIFKDTTVMPRFTFLPALAIGPAVGVVSGALVGYNCRRILRYV